MIKNFNKLLSQKNKSLKNVYNHIYHLGPVTKRKLISISGLTQTTCTRLIDELLQNKLIEESGYDVSSGGRKPVLYKINPNSHLVIGVDISRTYSKILLLNLNLDVLEEETLTLDSTTTPVIILNFLNDQIHKFIQKHRLCHDNILGIGIGSVGPLDREKGIILNPAYTPTEGWENISIKDILQEKSGLDVLMDYGVNTALLAEYQHLPKNKHHHIAHIIHGAGIRTGLILDGQLIKGSNKFSRFGQGHTIVDINGRKCTCGNYGCVQAYATIGPILHQVALQLSKLSSSNKSEGVFARSMKTGESITFDELCEAIENGDPLCTTVVKEAAEYAGIGLANIINLLQLDLIILGGPVYRKLDLFFETAKYTATAKISQLDPKEKTIITRGTLGSKATAIGAGSLVLQHYLQDV